MARAKKQGRATTSVTIDKDGAKATTTRTQGRRAKSVTTVVEKPKGATSAHTGAKNGKAGSGAKGKATAATRGDTARQKAEGDLESLRRSVENAYSAKTPCFGKDPISAMLASISTLGQPLT